MVQFLVEEAAATCLELHEAAATEQAAAEQPAPESDVRARHRRLLETIQEQQG